MRTTFNSAARALLNTTGSVTVAADSHNGKHLNSLNDFGPPHPDGSVWVSVDPTLSGDSPGLRARLTRPRRPIEVHLGTSRRTSGATRGLANGIRALGQLLLSLTPSGRVDMVVSEEQLPGPNGIAFSPDYKKVYIVSQGGLDVFDLGSDNRPTNKRVFSDFMVDGVRCATDGVRIDVDGNVWCASNAGARVGYSGVTIWTSEGKLLGRIRLPEGGKRQCLESKAQSSVYGRKFLNLCRVREYARPLRASESLVVPGRSAYLVFLFFSWRRQALRELV